MKLETAIRWCIDTANLSNDGESMDIYKYMYRYKAIRDLLEDHFEAVYDEISFSLFGR